MPVRVETAKGIFLGQLRGVSNGFDHPRGPLCNLEKMIQGTCSVIGGSETRNGLRKFCALQNSGGLGWAVLQHTIYIIHIHI